MLLLIYNTDILADIQYITFAGIVFISCSAKRPHHVAMGVNFSRSSLCSSMFCVAAMSVVETEKEMRSRKNIIVKVNDEQMELNTNHCVL